MARIAPWFEGRPEAVVELRQKLRRSYPHLHVNVVGGVASADGTVAIGAKGRELSRFSLRVILPNDYPNSLPTVFETAHRIPRRSGAPGSHVNPDGSLCIGLPAAIRLRYGQLDLIGFLDGPVKSYLLGIFEVENGRPWPFGEWSHGDEGAREFYCDYLSLADHRAVRALLAFAQRPQLSWTSLCPCSSGKIVRSCHAPALRRLKSALSRAELDSAEAVFRRAGGSRGR